MGKRAREQEQEQDNMETDVKVRADAKLKTLPEERQAEIAEFAAKHTLAETVIWLRSLGIEVSHTAVSRFLTWHRLKEQMDRNEVVVQEMLAKLSEEKPELTQEEMSALGQVFFLGLALEKQDPRGWHMAQRTGIWKAQLQFEMRKYQDTCELARAEVARLKDPDHKPSQEETLAIVNRLDQILGFKR